MRKSKQHRDHMKLSAEKNLTVRNENDNCSLQDQARSQKELKKRRSKH